MRSGFVDWRWVFLAVFSSLLLVTRLRGEEKEKKKERKREKKERKRKKTSWKKGGRVKGRKGLPNLPLSVDHAPSGLAAELFSLLSRACHFLSPSSLSTHASFKKKARLLPHTLSPRCTLLRRCTPRGSPRRPLARTPAGQQRRWSSLARRRQTLHR